jgi:two-component system sensor histidine kinase MtrB
VTAPLVSAPRRRLALRARVSSTFALVSLLLIVMLASTTYFVARSYMIDQRERSATRQAFGNARLVKAELQQRPDTLGGDEVLDVEATLDPLQGELGNNTLIHVGNSWYSASASTAPGDIPGELLSLVEAGGAGRQRVTVAGTPHIVVGTAIVSADVEYFEFVPLDNLERTLRILAGSLAAASILTAVAGAGVGWYASRRLLRPLGRVSAAAVGIAGGHLETRLDDEGDHDLEPLVRSFNDMAESLQQRIEREARFASDVSHELRTPLTALSTAVQVVRARADDLPPRTRLAVDVLETQIRYFERLVLDLLEISRIDAGAEGLVIDEIDVVEVVRAVASRYEGVDVVVDAGMKPTAALDRRRLERVLVNLLDNAEHHAGGATRITIGRRGYLLVLAIDDAGPGIPDAERDRVFGRFWRGPGARQQAVKGTGLGLSLVAEHVRAHGGRVRVESSPEGGARFVVEMPAGTP